MNNDVPHAYNKLYLNGVMELTRLLFWDFVRVFEEGDPRRDDPDCIKLSKYDYFSLVDAYMQTSPIRKKMDEGNWSALNKGDRQLINSINLSRCRPRVTPEYPDYGSVGWMAYLYVLLQWTYNVPSAEINRRIPAKELYRTFNPLHETSEAIACEKLYNLYFQQNKQTSYELQLQ